MDARKAEIAANMATLLRELADACERAAGEPGPVRDEAMWFLRNHRDGYWHGLVVGAGTFDELLNDDE